MKNNYTAVRCIKSYIDYRNISEFTKGKIYIAYYINEGYLAVVKDDKGATNGWFAEFFEPLNSTKLIEILYSFDFK